MQRIHCHAPPWWQTDPLVEKWVAVPGHCFIRRSPKNDTVKREKIDVVECPSNVGHGLARLESITCPYTNYPDSDVLQKRSPARPHGAFCQNLKNPRSVCVAQRLTTISQRAQAAQYPSSWFSLKCPRERCVQLVTSSMLSGEQLQPLHGLRLTLWTGKPNVPLDSAQSVLKNKMHMRSLRADPVREMRAASSL